MATSESPNKIVDPLLRNTYQIGTQRKPFFSVIVKQINKRDLFHFVLFSLQRTTPLPKIGLWTLSPRFLRGFHSP